MRETTVASDAARASPLKNTKHRSRTMKKTAFFLGTIFFLSMAAAPSHAFDFYGCWKADKKRKTNNIICFSKSNVRSDKNTYPDPRYREEGGKIFVHIPSTFANIEFLINEDQSISTIDPQAIGRKIRYIQIPLEEAKKLLK